MAAPLLVPLCLALALLDGSVQEPRDAQAPVASPDFRLVARKVDALLHRETGSNLVIDDATPGTVHRFRRPTNRVMWTTSNRDQRLVSIAVEPIGPEEEGTTTLMAALLVSVSAVDTLEEGTRMAVLLKEGSAPVGMARMVSLKNGVKLYREQSDHNPPKYRINL